jgi:hypothetical protein
MKVDTRDYLPAAKSLGDSSKIQSNISIIYHLLDFMTPFEISNVHLGRIQINWLSI